MAPFYSELGGWLDVTLIQRSIGSEYPAMDGPVQTGTRASLPTHSEDALLPKVHQHHPSDAGARVTHPGPVRTRRAPSGGSEEVEAMTYAHRAPRSDDVAAPIPAPVASRHVRGWRRRRGDAQILADAVAVEV